MLDPFHIMNIVNQFIPPHKQVEIQDRVIDTLAKAFPDERWRTLIQAYRSDAAFQDALAKALKRAVQRFAVEYQDRELIEAVTQDARFWDRPSVRSALQEIITSPSSYLQQERNTVFRSFADVLPTVELERVESAVHFFLRCLTQEVITIPQLAPIYQVQFQWASLEQSHQLVGLQRDQNQLMTALVEAVAQNQLLLAAPAALMLPKAHDNLPPQYGEFLGREKDIKRVLDALRSRWPLVSIEGLGGMGKTTLAIQIAHCCLAGSQAVLDPPFEYVVWVSAKDRPEQKLWLNDVLDTIARLLGYLSITKLSLEQTEQKKAEVHQLLHNYRTLLIIDNFETIKDSALESWIQDVPDPSKVLITSRTAQLRSARPITLKGLEDAQALELIRNHAQSLDLQSIATAKQDALLPLVRVTGGNPKVMGMALGYIKRGRLSLNEVIEHLHVASKTVNGIFDDLFTRMWNVMTSDAQHALLVIPFFADFASKEALGATAGLTEYHLDSAVEELVELKLLDIKEESVAFSQHYSVHPLTRAFARARLQEAPEFEEQARMRWSKYYLEFAARSLVRDLLKERYWNSLSGFGLKLVDPEWSNLKQVLEWADQQRKDQLLVELTVLLVHYMDRRLLHISRLYYAQRAAEAAHALGWKKDEALFRIDALGWILIDAEKFIDAEQEITAGIHIAEGLGNESSDASDLVALGNITLARLFLERGEVERASELMDNLDFTTCKPVIQYRAYIIGGDIAQRKKKSLEALKLYKNAFLIAEEYGGEGEGFESFYRVGFVYLATGEIEQAETYFNKAIVEHYGVTSEMLYSKYGLARVARAKGEREKARQLATEVLGHVSRAVPSHGLVNQIQDFLKDIETE